LISDMLVLVLVCNIAGDKGTITFYSYDYFRNGVKLFGEWIRRRTSVQCGT
jgi:hypothetical protein